jgi:hypothetical protein
MKIFIYFILLIQYLIKYSDGSIPTLMCIKPGSNNNNQKKFLVIGKFIEGLSGLYYLIYIICTFLNIIFIFYNK